MIKLPDSIFDVVPPRIVFCWVLIYIYMGIFYHVDDILDKDDNRPPPFRQIYPEIGTLGDLLLNGAMYASWHKDYREDYKKKHGVYPPYPSEAENRFFMRNRILVEFYTGFPNQDDRTRNFERTIRFYRNKYLDENYHLKKEWADG